MLRFLTAGESHGPALTAVLEGMVSGVPVSAKLLKGELARRRHGYGRGTRMKLEEDRLDILGGVRHGRTIGSPISLVVHNTEWPKWQRIMAVEEEDAELEDPALTRPRPGHADLVGMQKYGFGDARSILERASARETAARVAVGAVCKSLLSALGATVLSHVIEVGGVRSSSEELPGAGDIERIDSSDLRTLDADAEDEMKKAIEEARRGGDTLGGVFEVIVYGLPPGLGSHVHWDRRIDGRLAQALMSIQAIKGVEVGPGFEVARTPGSRAHDEIAWTPEGGYDRATGRSGGTEGGMTTGGPLRVRAAMKPLSSLAKPLGTVDVTTKEDAVAITQRSDVCAVPAAGVVGEAMIAFVIAEAMLEKFGGDSVGETRRNLRAYLDELASR
ncbi:MAG TPA: chorismate synthase [Actinomycetota bacterium]|nr:chorismate synthase [Actinomycetota bacterium]